MARHIYRTPSSFGSTSECDHSGESSLSFRAHGRRLIRAKNPRVVDAKRNLFSRARGPRDRCR
jgi:hypothetical protein